MKKKAKIILAVTVSLAGLLLIGTVIFSVLFNNFLNDIRAIEIEDMDISLVPDGIYEGGCSLMFGESEVKVTVKDGRITGIDMVKFISGNGEPALEILDRVIARQTLNVDVVSGATGSSMIILESIEKALLKASL